MIATLLDGSLLNSGSCWILVALRVGRFCVAAKNRIFFFLFFPLFFPPFSFFFSFFSSFYSLVKHKSALESWNLCGTWQVFKGLKSHATPRKWNGVKHSSYLCYCYSTSVSVLSWSVLMYTTFLTWSHTTCTCASLKGKFRVGAISWNQPNSWAL